MNFNIGDRVVHKTFGVGIVVSIDEMNLPSHERQLYYRVDFFKTTIWAPVNSQSDGGLRPITPKSHLHRYRALLESLPVSLDGDFYTRRNELERRLDGGTFQGLCEVIRDLNALSDEKPLNNYERTLFNHSREALALEWAMSSGTPQSETTGEIDRWLEQRK